MKAQRALPALLWAAALVLTVYEALRQRSTGAYGLDFRPVFEAAHYLRTLGDPYHPVVGSVFVYPPSSALLFYPVGMVSEHAALAGGMLLACVAAVVLSGVSGYLAERRVGIVGAVTLLLIAGGHVGWATFQQGNLSVTILALGAAALLFAVDDRWLLAGVILGVTLAIKPLLLPVLLMFLFRRQWRAFAAAVVIPAVLNLLTVPMLHDPGQFTRVILPELIHGTNPLPPRYNISLAAFGHREHIASAVILIARVAVVLAAAGVMYFTRGLDTTERLTIWFTVPTLAFTLVSNIDQPSYGYIAIPLAAVLIYRGNIAAKVIAAIGILLIMTVGADTANYGMIGQLLLIVAAWAEIGKTAAQPRGERGRAAETLATSTT